MVLSKLFFSRDRKTSNASLLCSRNFLVWKKNMDNRWGVYQVILSKLFLSDRAEKIGGVTLQCLRKFAVWEKQMEERCGVLIFSSKIICLTVPKLFVKESLCFINFGY